jgi:hypothetical protein
MSLLTSAATRGIDGRLVLNFINVIFPLPTRSRREQGFYFAAVWGGFAFGAGK